METGHFLSFFAVLISSTVCRCKDHVYVQTGGSVKLDIQKALPDFNAFYWMKDEKHNVVKFSKHGQIRFYTSFIDRGEFDTQTLSLTLKNLQMNDSGLYSAKTEKETETTFDQYIVSVIDPVDTPVLEGNVTTISVNSCIVNVSCTAHVLQLSTSYFNNCSQEEKTSLGIQNLTLYCIENVVVCNYSNPVSWKNSTLEINKLCTPHGHEPFNEPPEENNSPFPLLWLLVIIGVPVLFFTAVSAVICHLYKKPRNGAQQEELTVYAQVKPKNKVQRPLEMLEQSANPQTVYEFTGDHKQPRNSSPTTASPEIRTQTQPENNGNTIYSTIGQNQIPTGKDQTIYSAVSKPSRGRTPAHTVKDKYTN